MTTHTIGTLLLALAFVTLAFVLTDRIKRRPIRTVSQVLVGLTVLSSIGFALWH